MLKLSMASVRHDTVDRLTQRVCLACGYRGPELQSGYPVEVFVCPVCACDLYARPPRSYAEMEGVGVAPGAAPASGGGATSRGMGATTGSWMAAARWISRVFRRLLPPGL